MRREDAYWYLFAPCHINSREWWGIVESGMHTTGTGLWLWRSVMMDGGLLSKATLPIDGILGGVLTCSVAAWILYEHGKYSRTA